MTPFSIEWLRSAGAAGDIADVTGRLSGDKAELDFQGRQKGDSKLKLLAIRSVKTCLASGEIVPDDLMLIYDGKGSVVRAGIVTPDLHLMFFMGRRGKEDDGLRPAADVISRRSAAAYCARWRKAAGVKVLRKPWLPYRYTKREYYVPMRDGVRLYTAVYEAAGMARGGGAAIPEEGPKPIILMRSPYPVGTYGYGGVGDLSDKIRCFAERGYVIAEQNVRGTFMSEGEFEDVRPPAGRSAGNPGATDEATDTWDTVEWLLRNTRNNGSVGVYGVSYPGFYATMAAVCGHPAIKIASPQAPVTDWWMGDDAHHNGVLMLADMYSFGGGFFRPKGNPTPDPRESTAPVPEGADLYGFFRGKAISEILRPFLGSGPTGVKGESALAPENDAPSEVPLKGFADIAAHPDYDSFWRERNPLRLLRGVKPAVLVVGGLYDAEDAWGSIHTWRALREQSPETESYFVYGPWAHGGWRKDAGYLENIEAPVFEYYLEGKGAKPDWRALYIPTGAGAAVPGSVDAPGAAGGVFPDREPGPSGGVFPDREPGSSGGGESVLQANCRGTVRLPLPTGCFVSDPDNPVPYMELESSWRDKAYMWADQRFASVRPDVLSVVAEGPLKEAFAARGPVKVRVRFKAEPDCPASHGNPAEGPLLDADIVVKLIDTAPDGAQTLVRGDIAPARWRRLLSKCTAGQQFTLSGAEVEAVPQLALSGAEVEAVPLRPGQAVEMMFEMADICHVFGIGHSIMIQVQGSWFPLAAMNPQRFLPNPYAASVREYMPIRITILPGSELSFEAFTATTE